MVASKKEFTCICCPLGCQLAVELRDGANGPEAAFVTGFTCRRGREYAEREAVHPVRMLTLALPVEGRLCPVSAKTAEPISKELMSRAVAEAGELDIKPPVHEGDVLLGDVAGTGIALVATRTVR